MTRPFALNLFPADSPKKGFPALAQPVLFKAFKKA
ncbi:hypothetical protein X474_21840 [Dethiosulfatarculus sandiegensis]|uniref:Uncharacterized protein n=1 Tax=Dethiosulfatarculus sandiegensis TaxID=1429043 RepID=A0A0D2GAJ8_9BACT|nr:hypothetical protein X474_21840 [Dethiosulfatarculus sandiegensis]